MPAAAELARPRSAVAGSQPPRVGNYRQRRYDLRGLRVVVPASCTAALVTAENFEKAVTFVRACSRESAKSVVSTLLEIVFPRSATR